jgi:hypothetical protein
MMKNSYQKQKTLFINVLARLFGSNYRFEQLFNLMKNAKSRTKMCLTDELLEGCMRIATTDIKRDTERLFKQKTVSDISLMTDYVKEN